MNLIQEILRRRVPQILGSYLFAGSSSILFVAWLIDRYALPDYYTTLALFGLIAIMPSVIILSYFMEVVETIDSIAIARITGSQTPVYRVRIGDNVLIAK